MKFDSPEIPLRVTPAAQCHSLRQAFALILRGKRKENKEEEEGGGNESTEVMEEK